MNYVFYKDEKLWGESSEQTVVYMNGVRATLKVEPEYSVWIVKNINNYKDNILTSAVVASAMKSAMVSLTTRDVTNRSKIEPIAVMELQNAVDNYFNGNRVVSIISVNITNMDFEDSYNSVISQRQQAQIEYERQQIVNKTTIEQTEAQAKQKKIEAQGIADSNIISANAEAEAILIKAEAEAKANETIAKSLTDKIIQKMYYETWNGELPTTILGENSNVMIPMENK